MAHSWVMGQGLCGSRRWLAEGRFVVPERWLQTARPYADWEFTRASTSDQR